MLPKGRSRSSRRSFPNPNLIVLLAIAIGLGFLTGCGAPNLPSTHDSTPNLSTAQFTPEEMAKIEQNFRGNPKQYSQQQGSLILWRMHKKSPEFARKFAQTPELNDGIDEKEASAMAAIFEFLNAMNIPPALFDEQNPTYVRHPLKIEWRCDREITWEGRIYAAGKGSSFPGKISDVKPLGSEPAGDLIDYAGLEKSGFLSWHSKAGQGGAGGIAFTLEYPPFKKLLLNVNGKILSFSPADVSGRDLVFDEKRGLEGKLIIKYAGQRDVPREVLALRDMVLAGNGAQKFSVPLQALLWGFLDGYFKNGLNPFQKYAGVLPFISPIWGDMEGPRWEDFEMVASRLNLPELLDYYQVKKFRYTYSRSRGDNIPPSAIFTQKHGSCGYYASFTKYCLRKAGYDAVGLNFQWSGGGVDGHHIVIYTEKGKYYSLDRARKNVGILGPFENMAELLRANQSGVLREVRSW